MWPWRGRGGWVGGWRHPDTAEGDGGCSWPALQTVRWGWWRNCVTGTLAVRSRWGDGCAGGVMGGPGGSTRRWHGIAAAHGGVCMQGGRGRASEATAAPAALDPKPWPLAPSSSSRGRRTSIHMGHPPKVGVPLPILQQQQQQYTHVGYPPKLGIPLPIPQPPTVAAAPAPPARHHRPPESRTTTVRPCWPGWQAGGALHGGSMRSESHQPTPAGCCALAPPCLHPPSAIGLAWPESRTPHPPSPPKR